MEQQKIIIYTKTQAETITGSLDLEGVVSNKSAIGAIIKVKANVFGNPIWQMRRVAGQTGYCGQTLQQHFGLGDAGIIDTMIIEWPSGIKQVLTQLNVNEHLNISEDTTTTSVGIGEVLPNEFMLFQNYPNPFNPTTKIKYTIPNVNADKTIQSQIVSLKVFDVIGNEIVTLVHKEVSAGNYEVDFDASYVKGGSPSGVYFYQLKSGSYLETKKMIIIK